MIEEKKEETKKEVLLELYIDDYSDWSKGKIIKRGYLYPKLTTFSFCGRS